jgi:hypothetical protein
MEGISLLEGAFLVEDLSVERKSRFQIGGDEFGIGRAEENDGGDGQQSLFAEEKPDEEGRFLKQYISHYRRVQENG